MTVTLGVHGPKNLHVWMMDEYQTGFETATRNY
jgi:hypothetical protein